MHHKIFLLFLLIIANITPYAQKMMVNVVLLNKVATSNSDTIYYNADRKLTWNDFKGEPAMNHFGGAVTASGFAFDADMQMRDSKVNLTIYVYTFFDKKASWKKPTVNSEYHLIHEQHHFDITRLSAAKLCEEYRNANFTMSNYQQLLSSIFDKVFKENSVLQSMYDTETDHSINKTSQLQWNNKIEDAVKTL